MLLNENSPKNYLRSEMKFPAKVRPNTNIYAAIVRFDNSNNLRLIIFTKHA